MNCITGRDVAPRAMQRPLKREIDSPVSVPVAAGRRLRAAREALGVTQLEMAKVAGYQGANSIAQWESGAKSINPFRLAKIKARWGISLDFVYIGDMSGLPHKLAADVQNLLIRGL